MIDSNSARIVVDATGFHLDDWHKRARFTPEDLAGADLAGLDAKTCASGVLVLDAAQRVEDLAPWLNVLTAVEIGFDNAGDGRGFSLARALRGLGYARDIRASGGIHVDQFRHALQCGIDAVILTREAARRMPEQHWVNAAATTALNYQARLGFASASWRSREDSNL